MKSQTEKYLFLRIYKGDVFVIFLVTAYGFYIHYGTAIDIFRFLANFIPWVISWTVFARLFNLFNHEFILAIRNIWRVPLAAIIATPFAIVFRDLLVDGINISIVPLFMLIMGGIMVASLTIWRLIYRTYKVRKSNG